MTYADKIQIEFKEWYDNCYCSWVLFHTDWDRVIYNLCKKIEYTLNAYGFDNKDICVAQVKSKFGGLRFYIDNMGIPSKHICYKEILHHITDAELMCK